MWSSCSNEGAQTTEASRNSPRAIPVRHGRRSRLSCLVALMNALGDPSCARPLTVAPCCVCCLRACAPALFLDQGSAHCTHCTYERSTRAWTTSECETKYRAAYVHHVLPPPHHKSPHNDHDNRWTVAMAIGGTRAHPEHPELELPSLATSEVTVTVTKVSQLQN